MEQSWAFVAHNVQPLGAGRLLVNKNKQNTVRYDKPTRDVSDTYIDPNDPKAKQKAIHAAPKSFADYLRERQMKEGGGAAAAAATAPAPSRASAPPAAPAPAGECPGQTEVGHRGALPSSDRRQHGWPKHGSIAWPSGFNRPGKFPQQPSAWPSGAG